MPASNPLGGGTTALPAGTPYAAEFVAAGERHGISPTILAAVGFVESSYRPDAVSPAGAIGLMQLMPATAASLGVDPTDPGQRDRRRGPACSAASATASARSSSRSVPTTSAPAPSPMRAAITPGSQAERYVNKVLATEQGMR